MRSSMGTPDAPAPQAATCAPVGVFDSGVGGLSVLRVLRQHLPSEDWVYFADSGHAPYGEKSAAYVVQRTLEIADQLLQNHHIKALVVACNTATAEAIHTLRTRYPQLPIVGIEPGLKPALAISQTRRIGLMATQRTLESEKFLQLLQGASQHADITVRACPGLALAIEHNDLAKTEALIAHHTSAMGNFGSKNNGIDTLVLGCTHYPLARALLQKTVGTDVSLVDPADGVARQLERLLQQRGLHNLRSSTGTITALGSGAPDGLAQALERWCPAGTDMVQPSPADQAVNRSMQVAGLSSTTMAGRRPTT